MFFVKNTNMLYYPRQLPIELEIPMVDFSGSQQGLNMAIDIAAAAYTGLEVASEAIIKAKRIRTSPDQWPNGHRVKAHIRNGWTAICYKHGGQIWLELVPVAGSTNCQILRALLIMLPRGLAPSLHHGPIDHLVMRLGKLR
jgi:hypothetical protein